MTSNTAREEYEKFTRYVAREPGYDPGKVADLADAALAEADEALAASEASEKVKLDLTTELLAKLAQAEAEVERLKTALRLAAGELSTYGDHTTQHPQDVYDELLAGAERGGEK